MWLYNNELEIDGFEKLHALTTEGVPQAQYQLGLICQENQLLFLASDIWQDLLANGVEPRQTVAECLYEVYSWTGDIAKTEQLIRDEELISLRADLASRNYIYDRGKTASMAGSFLAAEHKSADLLNESWSFKAALQHLEAMANLSVLASQIAYSKEPFVGGAMVLAIGTEIWEEDLDERLNDAVSAWKSVRSRAIDLILELSKIGKDDSPEIAKIAGIALEAQERLFFFAGNLSVEDDETKSSVNNIAYALQWKNKIASNFYAGLAGI